MFGVGSWPNENYRGSPRFGRAKFYLDARSKSDSPQSHGGFRVGKESFTAEKDEDAETIRESELAI